MAFDEKSTRCDCCGHDPYENGRRVNHLSSHISLDGGDEMTQTVQVCDPCDRIFQRVAFHLVKQQAETVRGEIEKMEAWDKEFQEAMNARRDAIEERKKQLVDDVVRRLTE